MSGSVVPLVQDGADFVQQVVMTHQWMLVVTAVLMFLLVVVSGRRRWCHVRSAVLSSERAPTSLVDAGAVLMASAVAWLLATALGSTSGVFAAAAAVVASYTGLKTSVAKGWEFLLTAGAGLVIGQCASVAVGGGERGCVVAVVAAVAGGLVWRLPASVTRTLVTTALLSAVVAVVAGDHLVVDRVVAIGVGVCVGIAVGALPWPRSLPTRAQGWVAGLAADVSGLLVDAAVVMRSEVTVPAAQELLFRSRQLLVRMRDGEVYVHDTLDHLRLAPFVDGTDRGHQLATEWTRVCHLVEQTNAFCRDIYDAACAGVVTWPGAVADTAVTVAESIHGQSAGLPVPVGVVLDREQLLGIEDTIELRSTVAAVQQLQQLSSTAVNVDGSALVSDTQGLSAQ